MKKRSCLHCKPQPFLHCYNDAFILKASTQEIALIGASQNTVLKNFKFLITQFSHMGRAPQLMMLLKFTKD